MTDLDITRITIGSFTVSIIGLTDLLRAMASTHATSSDEEVQGFMLERLSRHNYIPAGAKADYGKAFVREFRKFLGEPHEEERRGELDVKVLGTGCGQCRRLTQTVMEVLNELNLPASVDHVTDIREIARYRVLGSPALLINGKVMAVGSIPPRERIKRWLLETSKS